MYAPRLLPNLLALFLLAAATHPAAAQWRVSAEVGSARFWGGSSEVGGSRSFRPYRPTLVGLELERAGHTMGVGARGYYARVSLALEGDEGVVAVKDALELYGFATELSGTLANLGEGARLMISGGPLVELWNLADQTSSIRAGMAAAVGLQVALGVRWSFVLRAGVGVTSSPFATEDLDPGFVPRALWRREVSGRLRYRL